MRFRGIVYRTHNPQWSWTPLSGAGAQRHGGRFNRRGIPALYTSLGPMTAIREAQPLGRSLQPITLCAYEVDADPVFDTRDNAERAALKVADSELACPAWEAEMLEGRVSASQRLADRLIEAGYVGMLVRSFAVGTSIDELNLVLWRWGDDQPSRVTLIDDEGRLVRNGERS